MITVSPALISASRTTPSTSRKRAFSRKPNTRDSQSNAAAASW
jgi:hypothetical protein